MVRTFKIAGIMALVKAIRALRAVLRGARIGV